MISLNSLVLVIWQVALRMGFLQLFNRVLMRLSAGVFSPQNEPITNYLDGCQFPTSIQWQNSSFSLLQEYIEYIAEYNCTQEWPVACRELLFLDQGFQFIWDHMQLDFNVWNKPAASQTIMHILIYPECSGNHCSSFLCRLFCTVLPFSSVANPASRIFISCKLFLIMQINPLNFVLFVLSGCFVFLPDNYLSNAVIAPL